MTKEENTRAKELYYHRVGYSEDMFPYLWDQCSDKYKEHWIGIAKIELEDETVEREYWLEEEYRNM